MMTLSILFGIFALLGLCFLLFEIWNNYFNDPTGEKEFWRKYVKTLGEYKKSRKD